MRGGGSPTRRRPPAEPADPTAPTLLAHVRAIGFWVTYHRLPPSLLGTVPACAETHALGAGGQQHVVKVVDDGTGDEDHRCACAPAESAGMELEG